MSGKTALFENSLVDTIIDDYNGCKANDQQKLYNNLSSIIGCGTSKDIMVSLIFKNGFRVNYPNVKSVDSSDGINIYINTKEGFSSLLELPKQFTLGFEVRINCLDTLEILLKEV